MSKFTTQSLVVLSLGLSILSASLIISQLYTRSAGSEGGEMQMTLHNPAKDLPRGSQTFAAEKLPSAAKVSDIIALVGVTTCSACAVGHVNINMLRTLLNVPVVVVSEPGLIDSRVKASLKPLVLLGHSNLDRLNFGWDGRVLIINRKGLLLASQREGETPLQTLARAGAY